MDRHIRDNLEDYMRGAMEPGRLAEFERRLAASSDQERREIAAFRQHAEMIREAYCVSEEALPAPGFYGRVIQRIQSQRSTSIWTAFLEPQFSRRLAFASLALLMLMSLTMLTTGPEEQVALDTTAPAYHVMDAMAEQEPVPVFGENQEQDRNVILVNLATYQEY